MSRLKTKFLYIDNTIINISDIACVSIDTDDKCIKVWQISDPKNPARLFIGKDNLNDKVNQISKQLLAID